jgi:hypothetical protein
MLAAEFSKPTLRDIVSEALHTHCPDVRQNDDLATLIATWLQMPDRDPPPLPSEALSAVYRALVARLH